MSRQQTCQACNPSGVFQRILVAVDASDPAQWAIQMAARIAKSYGAEVALAHVVPAQISLTAEFAALHAELAEDQRKAGDELLVRAGITANLQPRPHLILKVGEPSQQIMAAAQEWKADVIVIGTHGRGPVAHMLLGSTAESVARHAHIPVLTIGRDPTVKAEAPPAKAAESCKVQELVCGG